MHGGYLSRNSFDTIGEGGIKKMYSPYSIQELNRFTKCGLLVVDNQCLGGGKPTNFAIFRFNWAHDNFNLGLRLDAGEDGAFPHDILIEYNVAVRNQGGITQKTNQGDTLPNPRLAHA